jgi:hypothetical protein
MDSMFEFPKVSCILKILTTVTKFENCTAIGTIEKPAINSHVVQLSYTSCTFAVIQIWDNIGSLPFISWAISMKISGY